MSDLVVVETAGAVRYLKLNRPEKRNALLQQTLVSLDQAVADAANDPRLRVLVLAANGPAFCAGMDLGEMQQRAQSPDAQEQWKEDSRIYASVLSRLFSMEIPTIAVVRGPAVAGGVGLVLACDIVMATDDSMFALPEPMRGITAAMVTPLLIHRVGAGAATRLLLSGEKWSAESAWRNGLCHEITPSEKIDERVAALAESIQSGSREALAITKRHILKMCGTAMELLLAESMNVSAQARETADAREGLQAFLEKRKPNWAP